MISKEQILKIAKLARLNLTPEEEASFSPQFSAILDYFEQMSEVDTSDVLPMITPTEMEFHWREDQAKDWNMGKEVIEQAPEKSGNLFKVPPVVG
ncbi:MAG: Asp-tRNA(Asn)/Glu-tRNA(Gln) amidotransferase GatCAB subunit C [Bdellovibrionaceae bacterium]|nr:Asp-tRNA(Asn)/Glu-tRNA(Gln) amidotransferase GatCAB subunit C [Pseudobdellovibrionaceae bacterium]|tara:strand:- start:257 stop:541 length:285 start_codon:yes stop_codon:yes gene_type:complete